ncbi:MAG: hypothetical protein ACRERC_14575 [Candidatus Binatia bacterium]
MTRFGIVACATLLAAPLMAQPPPSCLGDCNLDGKVAINELLLGVTLFLDGAPPTGCAELDDDRDGVVRVNELVGAVGKALGECRLSGDEAAEAAAQAAITTADAFGVIDLGSASAGGGGGSGGGNGLAPMGAGEIGAAGGQIAASCPAGGTRDESCTVSRGIARLEVAFEQCTAMIGVQQVVVDGRLTRTVDDSKYCDTREISDNVEVTDALTEFRQTTTRPEGAGTSVFELSGTYARRIVLSGSGCNGRNGTELLNGSLAFRCLPGAPTGVVGCPAGGGDLSVVARDLTVVRRATGEVGDCTATKTLVGRLEVEDEISGQAFDTVYRQFFVAEETRGTGDVDLRFQGGLALDCLGEVSIITEVPLRRSPSARCPSAGILLIRLPDGLQRFVRYADGGLEVDLDGDGKPDRKTDSCEDPTLAQCQ